MEWIKLMRCSRSRLCTFVLRDATSSIHHRRLKVRLHRPSRLDHSQDLSKRVRPHLHPQIPASVV